MSSCRKINMQRCTMCACKIYKAPFQGLHPPPLTHALTWGNRLDHGWCMLSRDFSCLCMSGGGSGVGYIESDISCKTKFIHLSKLFEILDIFRAFWFGEGSTFRRGGSQLLSQRRPSWLWGDCSSVSHQVYSFCGMSILKRVLPHRRSSAGVACCTT